MTLRQAQGDADTIVAVATPPGEGALGVVRLSGGRALEVADSMFRSASGAPLADQKNFTARLGHVVEKKPGEPPRVVDEALVLLMRAPKSYTGEDTVEISAHGGPAVLASIVSLALGAGARPAEPGEFTKRAFLNGRLDLLQAEAVLDLIRAKTDRSREWAMSQLSGSLSRRTREWKDALVDILSHLEASFEFPDDFPDTEPMTRSIERLDEIARSMRAMLDRSELAFLAKRGARVALCGRPNVGKSSLLNRLVRTDRAIVTPYPGTTRDVVEEEASLAGLPVRFQDTAGIRETEHPIEKEGVGRSRQAVSGADLVLLVLDASQPLEDADRALIGELGERPTLVILNKSDLPVRLDAAAVRPALPQSWEIVQSSCVLQNGTDELEKRMTGLISGGRVETPGEALISTARQRTLLEQASGDLEAAAEAGRQGLSAELLAGDVRQALERLGELTGEVFNDEVLSTLFAQFCIGK